MVTSIIIATMIPLLFLYLIYRLDLYASRSYPMMLIAFVGGAIAIPISLFVANQLVFNFGIVNTTILSRYIAPITEELLKAAVLLILIQQARFTYFVDGAIYGFAAGMGFAIIENALYLSNNPDLTTAIGRVLSTNLMHATATAIVGIALGRAKFDHLSNRFLWLLLGLLMASLIHAGFNNFVTRFNGRFLLFYAAFSGLAGLGFIIFMIKRGLAQQKSWIEESLGQQDRVTAGETAIVQRLANIYHILTPLAAQFGPEKAQTIESFLLLQARLGILRKTHNSLKNQKMRQSLEVQITTLQQEIDIARRQVGPYCMIYLRHIFPQQNSPLWPQLEQQINKQKSSKPSGGNIWTTLNERTQSTSNGTNR